MMICLNLFWRIMQDCLSKSTQWLSLYNTICRETTDNKRFKKDLIEKWYTKLISINNNCIDLHISSKLIQVVTMKKFIYNKKKLRWLNEL